MRIVSSEFRYQHSYNIYKEEEIYLNKKKNQKKEISFIHTIIRNINAFLNFEYQKLTIEILININDYK